MADQLEEDIIAIISEIAEIDPQELRLKAELGQIYELDSVAMLEILVAMERRYKIRIEEKEINTLIALKDVVALVRRKTGSA